MKVVIWGHPLHSHTHSYIHESFVRAFRRMGHETYWLHDGSDVSGFDFSNCLLLTEGQADRNIPIRKDCRYILHNCDGARYAEAGPRVSLQVYSRDAEKWAPREELCVHVNRETKAIWQPWATDLMPDEINPDANMFSWPRTREVWFIGTYGAGEFGNKPQLDAFAEACLRRGLKFKIAGGLSSDVARERLSKSFVAPALQGQWQVENWYVPCRIFKNVSYGQLGMTNNPRVNDLMEGTAVYDENMEVLIKKAIEAIDSGRAKEMVREGMLMVRDRHTYVTRIKKLLELFD